MTCPSAAKKSCGSHLYGVVPGDDDNNAFVQELLKAITFFVLGPILVKFHIRTRLSESFLIMCRFWKCSQKSCTSHQFTPYANWSVTKGCFRHFGESESFEQGTVRKLHTGLGGGPNLDSVWLTVEENSASHLFWLVQTCPNLSEPVHNTVTMYACRAMSIFALSNALILQSYVLSCWNCIFKLA